VQGGPVLHQVSEPRLLLGGPLQGRPPVSWQALLRIIMAEQSALHYAL
jgi:hypothetical protein